MYIHPEAWQMFEECGVSVDQPKLEKPEGRLSSDFDIDYCIYNIIF